MGRKTMIEVDYGNYRDNQAAWVEGLLRAAKKHDGMSAETEMKLALAAGDILERLNNPNMPTRVTLEDE